MKGAERVGEACGEQVGEFAALLVGETRIPPVGTRVLQVYLAVCHVEVAAHDDRFRRGGLPRLRQGKHFFGHVPCPERVARGVLGGIGTENDQPVGIGALDGNVPRKHALFKPLAKVAERVVPFHAMPDAGELVLRVRRVHVDKPELGELERDDAPLGVEVLRAQPMKHLQRRALGEDRRP